MLTLPATPAQPKEYPPGGGATSIGGIGTYAHPGADLIETIQEEAIDDRGMKIDRMFYARFESAVKDDPAVAAGIEAGDWDRVIDYIQREVFDKPSEFYSLEKLRRAAGVDRRLSLREILEKIFGLITGFKSKDELLEEEFSKFLADAKPDDPESIPALKHFFKAYATSNRVRDIIDTGELTALNTHPHFDARAFKAVSKDFRKLIPGYIKDYVSLNAFLD